MYIRDYKTQIPGALHDATWAFPEVGSVNRHGRKTYWRIYVKLFVGSPAAPEFVPILPEYFNNKPMDTQLRAWIKVDAGIEGGKLRKSEPTIVTTGKNLGKASATNVFCQALRDALGIYNKQLKKNVSTDGGPDGGPKRLLPMLSQVLKEVPAETIYVQRKYNGVRTIATLNHDVVEMYSRRGIVYAGFAYIKAELLPILQGLGARAQFYLDGEIYSHGVPLQDISGYARRGESTLPEPKFDYMIYDCIVADEPAMLFSARYAILAGLHYTEHCKLVETIKIPCDEGCDPGATKAVLDEYYKKFLAEGYEGAMIRTNSPYQHSSNDYHSKYLLKMKPVLDHEFTVAGWETGSKGKAATALMIICITEPGGIKFPVTPAMELADRRALAEKMSTIEQNGHSFFENHYLGKKIIVEFDEWSRDNVPQRARTQLQIRTWD